jgi:hypothetical protein
MVLTHEGEHVPGVVRPAEAYGIKLRSTGWWAPSAKTFVKFEHQDRRWNAELDSYGAAP